MNLTHKIALLPTPEQSEYFQRAAGTARFVWNWALAEWNRQYAAGQQPSAMAMKKQFNAIKYAEFPWLKDIHRDSHSQPFAHLGKAWSRFFADIKAGNKKAHTPCFKKKGVCRDSFYVANDQFKLDGVSIRLPKLGFVRLTEALRFDGKVLGATVARTASKWFVTIHVDVPEHQALLRRTAHGTVGVDLGVKAAATLSTGESIVAPKPLKAALRRLRIRGRRLSRKVEAAKKAPRIDGRLFHSNNRKKSAATLARLHARIANVRADFTHKLTTRLFRENQAVVLEDLNVKGMLANDRLARAISDVGFGEIRRQSEYKAVRYGTRLIFADRWYPSSKLCSSCDWKNTTLTLSDRYWTCQGCGTFHDRDENAALNLKRLATATALPVASPVATQGTTVGMVPAVVGEVTPVRYDAGLQGASGQEENHAHHCASSR